MDGDIVAKPEKKTSRIPPGFEDTELAVAIIHDEEFPKLQSQSVKARESSNDGGDRLEVLTVAEEWRLEDILRANESQNTPGCGEITSDEAVTDSSELCKTPTGQPIKTRTGSYLVTPSGESPTTPSGESPSGESHKTPSSESEQSLNHFDIGDLSGFECTKDHALQ